MVPLWKLQMMAKYIFRNYLSQKDKVLELANSILEAHITDTEESVDNSAQIEDYKRELEKVSRRIDNLIEMRSDGEIDKADFMKRKTEAEQKHIELQNKIAELEAEQNKATPVIDYKEKLEVLRYALDQYTNFDDDGDIPDSVIEAFVEKIVVSKDGFDWYLRFDGDPNDPLHLKTVGKRRNKTEIIDPKAETLGSASLNTGCY
jgi:soluble cytochrome b562